MSGISLLAFLIAGCSTDRQRGGQSSFKGSAAKSAPAAMSLAQGENQKGPSRQDYQRQISSGLIVPEGSKIIVTDLQADPATGEVRTNSMVIELSKPTKLERVETESQGTELGAHREDAVGLMTAKLKSVRWIQFLGFLLICAGLSTFHPVVRAFVGSKTLTAYMLAAGAVLIFLPYVIVGNESLLAVCGLGVLIAGLVWFLAFRNAKHKARAEMLEAPPNNS